MKINFFLVVIIIALSQVLSVLRLSGIYNTSNIITLLIGVNGTMFLIIFLLNILIKKHKVCIDELIFIFYITFLFFVSIIIYKNNSLEIFIDYFNFLVFLSILNLNFRKLLNESGYKIYIVLIGALIISLISYLFINKLGYTVGTGKTSIQMLYLYIYDLVFIRKNIIISFLLLFWAQKRGVLIAVLIVSIISYILNNGKKSWKKILIIFFSSFVLVVAIKFNSNLDNMKYIPIFSKAMFVKFNRINPLNSNKDLKEKDPRVVEIKSALKKIDSNLKILIGTGLGATYEHIYSNGKVDIKKNIHISPISLLYKIGIIGTILFYKLIFKYLFKLRYKNLGPMEKICYFYVIGGIINSITAYTYFVDYLFIICLAVLKKTYKINYKGEKNVK